MRVEKRAVALLSIAVAGVTCSFPTDDSDKVFVTIAPLEASSVVRRGEQLELYAKMFHTSGADTTEIHNVRFAWTTDNATIATVAAGGYGSATVTGVNSGTIGINARAVAFENAQSASFAVRVTNPVEIDSVRPRIVRWGEKITVYGVGVDSLILTLLDNVTLFDYPIPGLLPTRTRDSLGFSTASFWVTPPAHTDSISYIGPGVFGFARDTTFVLPFDRYEPNDEAPWPVDLEAPPIVPQIPQIRFFNPAVAFEQRPRAVVGADWYRLTQTVPRDLTIIINSADVRGSFVTYVSDSLYWNEPDSTYYIGLDGWTVGPETYVCHGFGFFPDQLQPDSTIVALRGAPLPQDTLHALSLYAEPSRYGLTVLEGYVSSDTRYPRDVREEDDFCNAADARTPYPNANVGFRDTLTIDNPFEVDWIRFRVGGTFTQFVRFRLDSLSAADTLGDIDLYVLGDTTSDLARLGSGERVGPAEDFLVALNPGEYYAVVVDYAGVPMRYAVCIGVTGCGVFPAPPGTAPSGESWRRKPSAPTRAPAVRPSRSAIR